MEYYGIKTEVTAGDTSAVQSMVRGGKGMHDQNGHGGYGGFKQDRPDMTGKPNRLNMQDGTDMHQTTNPDIL